MTILDERRNCTRYHLSLPVRLQPGDRGTLAIEGYTRDVSSGGAYFLTAGTGFESGSELKWEMDLPLRVYGVTTVRIRCGGEIVRVESLEELGKTGVAAKIKTYTYVRTE